MIASIFDLEKNRNMLWNQGSQLFHLPHETEFFHEIFIFSTSLMYIYDIIKERDNNDIKMETYTRK